MPDGFPLLESALSYLHRGWSVIPIDSSRGKKTPPKGFKWKPYQSRRPTEDETKRWFGPDSNANGVAVITGDISGGLACRDFDQPKAYHDWTAAHPELARSLPTVRTARGLHVYLRAEEDRFAELGDGEYRGTSRQICILPPSRHPAGVFYQWSVPLPPGELPIIDPVKVGFLSGPSMQHKKLRARRGAPASAAGPVGGAAPAPPQVLHLYPESPVCPESLVLRGDDRMIQEAIRQTLPKGQSQRFRSIFEFARHLRAIPELADCEGNALRPLVVEWHRQALPFIGTTPFFDTWMDFVNGWAAVRVPASEEEFLKRMMDQARLEPTPSKVQDYPPKLRLLVALAAVLQRAHGDRPFFLGCRSPADWLEVDFATVSRGLKFLVNDGVLKLVTKGDMAGNASEYRYLLAPARQGG
jgi:hypothetical protein